jgi:hypothetical protein
MLIPFSNFVFVDSMVAAPVSHVDNWVAVYRGCVTAAASNNLVIWRHNCARYKLWDKPNTGGATHP